MVSSRIFGFLTQLPLLRAAQFPGGLTVPKMKARASLDASTKGRFTRYDFVAYGKLTTGLQHESFRVNQTYNSLTMS